MRWRLVHRGEEEESFLAAYGANRRYVADGGPSLLLREFQRTGGLFREDPYLAESVQWLKDLDYRSLAGGTDASRSEYMRDRIVRMLNDGLLPAGLEVSGVTPDGIRARWRGADLMLQSVGQGHRMTTTFVVDLIMRAYKALQDEFRVDERGDGHLVVPHAGVVLIDEMELHLHPSWQQRIGFWLKEHFPNVQFLVTTHSPFICQAADTLVRLSLPGEERPVAAIVDEDTHRRVVGGGADDAVVSDLFGLERPHSDEAEREREQLAVLEAKELGGTLDERDRPRLRELQRKVPATPAMAVERIYRKIVGER